MATTRLLYHLFRTTVLVSSLLAEVLTAAERDRREWQALLLNRSKPRCVCRLLEGFIDPTTPQSDKHIYCVFAARNFGWRPRPVSNQSNPHIAHFSIILFIFLFSLPFRCPHPPKKNFKMYLCLVDHKFSLCASVMTRFYVATSATM